MADSIRKQILDRVDTALSAVSKKNGYNTTIRYVSSRYLPHTAVPKSRFPAVFYIAGESVREFRSWANMQETIPLLCTGMLFARNNVTAADRDNMIRDIEKALVSDTTLGTLAMVTPTGVVTDEGQIKNYAIWDQTFDILYFYDRADGG